MSKAKSPNLESSSRAQILKKASKLRSDIQEVTCKHRRVRTAIDDGASWLCKRTAGDTKLKETSTAVPEPL